MLNEKANKDIIEMVKNMFPDERNCALGNNAKKNICVTNISQLYLPSFSTKAFNLASNLSYIHHRMNMKRKAG